VAEQNVDAGAYYLSWLMRRYANNKDQMRRAIAAYNAGPGAVERYRGVPPYRETRTYVTPVLRFYKKYNTTRRICRLLYGWPEIALINLSAERCTTSFALAMTVLFGKAP